MLQWYHQVCNYSSWYWCILKTKNCNYPPICVSIKDSRSLTRSNHYAFQEAAHFNEFTGILQGVQLRELKEEVMYEQVPEMYDSRTKKWTGIGIFQTYRGKLGQLEGFFKEIFTDKKSRFHSPTVSSFKRKCKGVLGPDLQVLGVKILQLIRDKQQDYADEVLRALFRNHYKLPGEISPGKLVPYTVIMLDPQKTVAAIRWVLCHVFPEELIYYHHPERRCHDRPLSSENGKILEAFPSLWKYVQVADKERMIHSHNDFVRLAYAEDVLQKYIREIVILYQKGGKGLHLNYSSSQYLSYDDAFASSNEGVNSRVIDGGFPKISKKLLHFSQYLAFIIKGEQQEIRGIFPREANVATWQLRLPENNFPEDMRFKVGIHEESAHDELERKLPMFISKGDSGFKMKAIAIPHMHHEVSYTYPSYTQENIFGKSVSGFRVLFDVSERDFRLG